MMMSPHAEPTAGCSEPDSSWQSAAARPGTTLSVPAPGRPPGHRQVRLHFALEARSPAPEEELIGDGLSVAGSSLVGSLSGVAPKGYILIWGSLCGGCASGRGARWGSLSVAGSSSAASRLESHPHIYIYIYTPAPLPRRRAQPSGYLPP